MDDGFAAVFAGISMPGIPPEFSACAHVVQTLVGR
jgi:hypothetical protein